jgi:hypothetical protein
MRSDLKKFILEKLTYDQTLIDKRANVFDRRKLRTYIAKDKRSGFADRRIKLSALMENLPKGFSTERRKSKHDRRKTQTYIADDKRSGLADRRSR